mmetsp:Transcript_1626/g.3078  ORF Transcript_1626/g.3078 Transcript_1626/m.3078 type:complete len:125 (+) Transcript_1626:152-526(+)
MRTFIVAAFIAGATAFAPAPISSRHCTALNEFLSPEERADKIQRWGEIRAMSAEEAEANLSGEELETYKRYYAETREGVLKMQELAKLMMKGVEPPRIAPKSKSQRKRDKWAKVQAREAARANA